MKKMVLSILFSTLLLTLCSGLTVQAAEGDYQPPKREQADGWTVVLMPDPQQYTSQRNFPILEIMMNWLVENKETLNIGQVVVVGDMVNNNKSEEQWSFSSRAFAMLDGVYPYALCTGNHDYGGPKATADSRETAFNDHYPSSRNSAWNGVLIEKGKNTFNQETLENAVYEQTLPGGKIFVVISLPFAPTDESLDWAKKVADQPKYDQALVAIVTHDYMLPDQRDNALDKGKNYQLQKDGGASGQEIWDKLVFPSKNIRFVFCGHHSADDNPRDCTGFRTDKNASGRTVYQMIFDTQALGGGFGGNGGDGWLRLLEFSNDGQHVRVRTFSPFFALSPSTQKMAWGTESYNQFEFDIEN